MLLFLALIPVFLAALWLGGEIYMRVMYGKLLGRLPQAYEEWEADAQRRWEENEALDALDEQEKGVGQTDALDKTERLHD